MTQHYLRLFSSVPDGQKPPGMHPDWPVTKFSVPDGDPPPPDMDPNILIGPFTDEEVDQYLEDERPAYEAALAANASAMLEWRDSLELPDAKTTMVARIDARTQEVISRGFTYNGKQFSLSQQAQSTLLGTFTARDVLSYPVRWNTIDDLDAYDLAHADDVVGMYGAAVAAVRAALDSGTALKDQVRNATTTAALNAIVDVR